MAARARPSPGGGAEAAGVPWAAVRERLRARGLRWTPQRRVLVDVLSRATGHVSGGELIERCRAVDPETVPSTVYRTLAVLEELGLVSHSHGHDGREEFHVLPKAEHGHLQCTSCGRTWELPRTEAAAFIAGLEERRGFAVQPSHLSIGGLCRECRAPESPAAEPGANAAASGERAAVSRATPAVTPPRAAPRGR